MWDAADAYERFMGRWSVRVAEAFLDRAPVPAGGRCLDVGCGVGTLARVVAGRLAPDRLVGVDASAAFVAEAARAVPGLLAVRADAARLPFADASFDTVVSGLVLNFVPDPARALAQVGRVLRPGGACRLYVWDYDHPDFFLARLWQGLEVVRDERDPHDERGRWPVCTQGGLVAAARGTGLAVVAVTTIDVDTPFADHGAMWDGFLQGVGPTGHAVRALDGDGRRRLRDWLVAEVPTADDGTVRLTARALGLTAVSGQG